MRYARQNKILELIKENDIDTQEMLVALLKESGFNVTQATISRDIKELHLVKNQVQIFCGSLNRKQYVKQVSEHTS